MLKKFFKSVSNDKGMTLIEVLIGLLLLSVIAVTFFNVFTTAFRVTTIAEQITEQTYATQALVEEYRVYNYRELFELKEAQEQTGEIRQPVDFDGNGTIDYYSEFAFEPYGVCDMTNGEDATYVHIVYFVNDALVVTGQGESEYFRIRPKDNSPTILLTVPTDSLACTLKIYEYNEDGVYQQTHTFNFNRKSLDAPVVLMANLELKDFGYNSNLRVEGDLGKVDIKVYGNSVIVDEFGVNITSERSFSGITNTSVSLVKMTIELFEEIDSTDPVFEMSEIVEIYNGEKDSLVDELN